MQTQTVIVYRNPLEQEMWEFWTPYIPYIAGVALLAVIVIVIYNLIQNRR